MAGAEGLGTIDEQIQRVLTNLDNVAGRLDDVTNAWNAVANTMETTEQAYETAVHAADETQISLLQRKLMRLENDKESLQDDKKALQDKEKALLDEKKALLDKEKALLDKEKALLDKENLVLQIQLQQGDRGETNTTQGLHRIDERHEHHPYEDELTKALEKLNTTLESRLPKPKAVMWELRVERFSGLYSAIEWRAVLRGRFEVEIEVQPSPLFDLSQSPWYSWTQKVKGKIRQVSEPQGTPTVCCMLQDQLKAILKAKGCSVRDVHSFDNLNHVFDGKDLSFGGGADVFLNYNVTGTPLADHLLALGELKRLNMGEPATLADIDHNQVQSQLLVAKDKSHEHFLGLFAFLTNCYEWWFYDFPGRNMRRFGPYSSLEALGQFKSRLQAFPDLADEHSWQEKDEHDKQASDGDPQSGDIDGGLGEHYEGELGESSEDQEQHVGNDTGSTEKSDAYDDFERVAHLCVDNERPIHVLVSY